MRTTAGMSQENLAERSGLSRNYVSDLERGLKKPTITTIFRLAAALGTPPHELIRAIESGRGKQH
jgi:transcriptional regulator with XRE-family HTH domain